MKNDRVYRHELKYLINMADYYGIRARIAPVIPLDRQAENGGYNLRSLYFDDLWNTAYQEKLMGIDSRRKYRIRVYDAKDTVIKLECKEKAGQYIYKRSANLSRSEHEAILAGDTAFLLDREESVCQDFYLAYTTRVLRPRVIVEYDREPFVMDTGTVRITFDKNVSAGVGSYDLFDPGLPVVGVLEPGKMVMEVKFTEFLPQLVRDILPPKASEFTAVSKYVLCFEAIKYRTAEDFV
jgi:hypothetical protein